MGSRSNLVTGWLAIAAGVAVSLRAGYASAAVPPPMFHGCPWPLDAQGHPMQGTTMAMELVDPAGHMTGACINRSSGHVPLVVGMVLIALTALLACCLR